MRVLLAPMEGVLDSLVRELLTEVNDYDLCITEFVRVVDQLLPVKVFHRICPELQNASRTPSGTLVRVQLLGQFPQWLAENAARAVELGSWGVDLNCGWTKFMKDQHSTIASSNNLNWIITAN
ncbi:tRNA-dihydrouridine synthase [Escherichia coli]|nr:tRNA-dihydrouridine synthase [Escherichia coli]BEA39649.1 hypothetical protein VEE08_15260 [Escherichia coli]HAV7444860.1 tRNA-dihydrouridine synthase [Escherichia coli]